MLEEFLYGGGRDPQVVGCGPDGQVAPIETFNDSSAAAKTGIVRIPWVIGIGVINT